MLHLLPLYPPSQPQRSGCCSFSSVHQHVRCGSKKTHKNPKTRLLFKRKDNITDKEDFLGLGVQEFKSPPGKNTATFRL